MVAEAYHRKQEGFMGYHETGGASWGSCPNTVFSNTQSADHLEEPLELWGGGAILGCCGMLSAWVTGPK